VNVEVGLTFDLYRKYLTRPFKAWLRKMLAAIGHKLDGVATDIYFGHQIFYDPTTDIGELLLSSGEFEKKEMEVCKEYISESSNVLDLGANIGLHSIYFSGLVKNGLVLAFEPSLETFGFLVRNVANIPNIVPINIAASGKGAIADFFHTTDNAYSGLKDTRRKGVTKVLKVPCMQIDDVVSGLCLDRVDFVKIDVEGLEFDVLKGMIEVIERFSPVIFCEIYSGNNSNQEPEETVRFLIDKGYRAQVICNGKLVEYEKHDDIFYNYLFLPTARY